MIRGQRRREPIHRHGLQQRQRAAAVIGVLVRDDHGAQARDARRAQERRDDAAAGVGVVGEARAGVVEQRVPVRLARRRRAPAPRRAPSSGMSTAPAAAAAPRTAAGTRRRPARGRARRAARPATARPPARPPPPTSGGACCCHTAPDKPDSHSSGTIIAAKTIVRRLPQRVDGNRDPGQRQRHHDERDHRDRQRVRDRRDQRHHLEQRKRHRHQTDGDEHLRARGDAQRPAARAPCGRPPAAGRAARRGHTSTSPRCRTTARSRA